MSQIKIKQIEGLQATLDSINASLESGSLKSTYEQVSHGFSEGNAIAFLNGSWILADASISDKLGRLIVESVTTNSFIAVQIGNVEVIGWNLTPGKFYLVDETGNGTLLPYDSPTSPNVEYSNPVIQAITSEKAQVLPWRPSLGSTPLAQGQEYSQTASPQLSDGQGSSTGIILDYTPFAESTIQVYINGVGVTESYGNLNGEVYFSNDGGLTSLTVSSITEGCILYWNADTTGYEIGNADSIDLVYEKSSID